MESISNTEIKVGLQFITLPEGETVTDLGYYKSVNQYSETDDTLHFCKHNDRIYCERVDSSFGYSVFGVGDTEEQAIEETLVVKAEAQPGVYFENSGDAYLVRELMKIDAPRPDPLPFFDNPTVFRKAHITNYEVAYTTGKNDETILVVGINCAYVFQYSGDETYPLGKCLWGQVWLPGSIQYLGSSRWAQADEVLMWRLNRHKLSDVLSGLRPEMDLVF